MDYGPVNMQLNVRPNVFGNGGWASVSNTYFVQSDLPIGPDLIAEFTSAADHLFERVRRVMGGPDIYCICHYRPRGPSTFPDGEDEIAIYDGGYTEAAPWWCSLMVKKFTGPGPTYDKGRAYIPFIGKPLGGGPLVDPDSPELQDAADAFSEVITSGSMVLTPIIWRAATGVSDIVVSTKMSQFLAFQRRRNASTRYYEFP